MAVAHDPQVVPPVIRICPDLDNIAEKRYVNAAERRSPMARLPKDIVSDMKSYLEYLKAMGIESLPGLQHPAGENHSEPPDSSRPGPTLSEIRRHMGECQRCKLHRTRRTLVFGEGDEKARLMFIGEGPGYDEDVQGRPFVGKAGQLLTKIIESMRLERNNVYIANIVKCRPPNNRNPEPDEIAACEPFLLQQFDCIQPQIICALGKFAAQTLLKTDIPISRLRGRFHDYHGIKLMPTYHPAYLLRNPGDKRLVWEDMQLVQKAYHGVAHHAEESGK